MSTHDVHARNKAALAPLRAAQYNYEADAVRAANISVTDIRTDEVELEDIFLQLTSGSSSAAAQ